MVDRSGRIGPKGEVPTPPSEGKIPPQLTSLKEKVIDSSSPRIEERIKTEQNVGNAKPIKGATKGFQGDTKGRVHNVVHEVATQIPKLYPDQSKNLGKP